LETGLKAFLKRKNVWNYRTGYKKRIKKLEKDIETLNNLKYKYIEDYKNKGNILACMIMSLLTNTLMMIDAYLLLEFYLFLAYFNDVL